MKVTPLRTHKITSKDTDLLAILDKYVTDVKEESIVAIASKIVAICEGRMVKIGTTSKDKLVQEEADFYIDPSENPYGLTITIKDGVLIPAAGIDESNSDGHYILWPKSTQHTAVAVRDYLQARFKLKKVGVIVTDIKTSPMRWGTTGVGIGYSGFLPLKDYIGERDLFDREIQVTKSSHLDALAAGAVLTMGEGAEQTPLAIVEDVPFVKFVDRNPTVRELKELQIDIEDDLYAPLLKSAPWKKGKN